MAFFPSVCLCTSIFSYIGGVLLRFAEISFNKALNFLSFVKYWTEAKLVKFKRFLCYAKKSIVVSSETNKHKLFNQFIVGYSKNMIIQI